MDAEDECEFPDDWGCEGEAVADDEALIEAEEDLQVVEEDLATEDVLEDHDEVDAEYEPESMQVDGADPEEEHVLLEDAETQKAETVVDDDDDDLAAEEAAALAALGVEDQAVSRTPAPALGKGPGGKAPITKAPVGKAPAGSLSGKLPLGKGSFGKGSVGQVRGPLPVGKLPWQKGSVGQAPPWQKGAPAPWQKGGKQTPMTSGGKSYGSAGKGVPGKGVPGNFGKGVPGKGVPGKGVPGNLGKAFGKNKPSFVGATVGQAPVRPVAQGQGGSAAKAKGKGVSKDGGVGHKVLALNKKGHWQSGRGLSVKALEKLRELPHNDALEMLAELDTKGASVQNPTKFIIDKIGARANGGSSGAEGKASCGKGKKAAATDNASSTPPWRSGPGAAPADRGIKRPAPVQSAAPAAKRAAPPAQADEAGAEDMLEQLEPAVFAKVKEMMKTHEFGLEALRALGSADEKDANILLQAFLTRAKAGKAPDLTRFIVKSLEARRAGAGQAPPSAGAKAGVAKAPLAKAPMAKAPVAKAPAARVPIQGIGKPPVARQDLDFDQLTVQGKLQSLNKLGIWEGSHPLDEAALGALLAIDSGRAHEILDETEEKGAELKNPSEFVRTTIRDNPR